MSHAYHAAAITCNYRKPSFDTHAMFDSYKSGYTESSRGGGGGVYPTHPDDDNNIPERYRPEKLNFDKPPLLATPPPYPGAAICAFKQTITGVEQMGVHPRR